MIGNNYVLIFPIILIIPEKPDIKILESTKLSR